jgi:hypothetical protein
VLPFFDLVIEAARACLSLPATSGYRKGSPNALEPADWERHVVMHHDKTGGVTMATSNTAELLRNNLQYASGQPIHEPGYPGKQPIQPSRRVAVIACMDARLDVEDLLGLQTGEAHIIRNAGGVVTEDAIRCLMISHHLS